MDLETHKRHERLAQLLLTMAEEEDSTVYGMVMLTQNEDQLRLFGIDGKKVQLILEVLIHDTRKHQQLLAKAAHLVLKGVV